MSDMYDTGIADYGTTLKLALHGRRYNFNRQIPEDVLDRLDPQGTNVFAILLFDHDRSGRPDITNDPLHHRCQALLKITGEDKPLMLFVDISDEDFRSMEHVAPKASARS